MCTWATVHQARERRRQYFLHEYSHDFKLEDVCLRDVMHGERQGVVGGAVTAAMTDITYTADR